MDSAYYERSMLSSKKLPPQSVPQSIRSSILDTYILEFLDLPEDFSENNLRKAITHNLKQADRIFILICCSIIGRCPALFPLS